MRRTHLVLMVLTAFALAAAVTEARQLRDELPGGDAAPRLIKFNGVVKDGAGVPRSGTVGMTFSLYASQEGEEPLWRESQAVQADSEGRYTAYLGISERDGLPLEFFSTGRAQWLGVQVQGEKEEPRILLVAVPYALKAADADTVGGRSLSSFVLYEDLQKLQETDAARADKAHGEGTLTPKSPATGQKESLGSYLIEKLSSSGGSRNYFTNGLTPVLQIDGSGTPNRIAKFVDANNIGDSGMTDINGDIGVGTAAPDKRFQIASTPTKNAELHIGSTGDDTKDIFAGMGPNLDTGPAFNYGYAGFSFGRSAGFFNVRPDASAVAPNPSLRFMTANTQRMIITNAGYVGIGTTSPGSLLSVAGDVDTTTRYRIGGTAVLSIAGSNNVFAGASAGLNNTTGSENAFFGQGAGQANTTGIKNSFFGRLAGTSNTTANGNSFFGAYAGLGSTGTENSFFGYAAGQAATTGSYNSYFGTFAGFVNTTSSNNSFFGNGAGRNNTAANNAFFGQNAGNANTSGTENSFFGQGAGQANTTGTQNSYFGRSAGRDGVIASQNSFFGTYAGILSTGSGNSYFGAFAGQENTSGAFNSFVGSFAGFYNKTGGSNSFFGQSAGINNTSGDYNVIIGQNAGTANTTESGNTYLGTYSDGAASISNATAIGYRSKVTQSNSLVLGSVNGVNGASASVSVGIGTTAPKASLHVEGGDAYVGSAGQGIILKSPDGLTCVRLTVNNAGALVTTPLACP
jgi:hypothetical protein